MNTRGEVHAGQLIIPVDGPLLRWLAQHEGEPVAVTLDAVWHRRSIKSNRRMWAGYNNLVRWAAASLNLHKDDLHAAMKARSEVLTPIPICLPTGEIIAEIKSTRNIASPTMVDFQDETGAYFADHGVDVWEER